MFDAEWKVANAPLRFGSNPQNARPEVLPRGAYELLKPAYPAEKRCLSDAMKQRIESGRFKPFAGNTLTRAGIAGMLPELFRRRGKNGLG